MLFGWVGCVVARCSARFGFGADLDDQNRTVIQYSPWQREPTVPTAGELVGVRIPEWHRILHKHGPTIRLAMPEIRYLARFSRSVAVPTDSADFGIQPGLVCSIQLSSFLAARSDWWPYPSAQQGFSLKSRLENRYLEFDEPDTKQNGCNKSITALENRWCE